MADTSQGHIAGIGKGEDLGWSREHSDAPGCSSEVMRRGCQACAGHRRHARSRQGHRRTADSDAGRDGCRSGRGSNSRSRRVDDADRASRSCREGCAAGSARSCERRGHRDPDAGRPSSARVVQRQVLHRAGCSLHHTGEGERRGSHVEDGSCHRLILYRACIHGIIAFAQVAEEIRGRGKSVGCSCRGRGVVDGLRGRRDRIVAERRSAAVVAVSSQARWGWLTKAVPRPG